jgi:hypothetical protein
LQNEDLTMILDERTYSIRPGMLDSYLESHHAEALPIMRRYLGEPFGYFVTETGELNQFVHFWRYDSMADRERRRGEMYRDADWVAYRRRIGQTGHVLTQHNRLLRAIDIPDTSAVPPREPAPRMQSI